MVYFYLPGRSSADREVTAIDNPPSSNPPLLVRQAPVASSRPIQSTAPASPPAPFFHNTATQVVVAPIEQAQSQAASRSAEAQRILEQARRDQAVAEQQRVVREQKLREEQKTAGRNEHVPLDQWQIINVGGEAVPVKIHDNDVTSFDVWIDYGVRRELKKEKGITHSGTDETLIYSNSRASLYYVWEISGRINHCLLRVRDA
jgi:hypothetical protein